MAEKNNIRLNKVLRELNLSLDKAVEYLSSIGYEIEARPTTKISEEMYKELVDKFTYKRNSPILPGIKTVGKIKLDKDKTLPISEVKKSNPIKNDDLSEIGIINKYKTLIATRGNKTSNIDLGFPKPQLVYLNSFSTRRLNREIREEYFPNSGFLNVRENYVRDIYERYEDSEFFRVKYQEARIFDSNYNSAVKYETLGANTRSVEKLPMLLDGDINEILEANELFHPYKFHSLVFIKNNSKVYGPLSINQISDSDDYNEKYTYKIQSLPTKTLELPEDYQNTILEFREKDLEDYIVYNKYGKNDDEEFYISNINELIKNNEPLDIILNESDNEIYAKINEIIPREGVSTLGNDSIVNQKRLEKYSKLKEKSDNWKEYLINFLKNDFFSTEEGQKLANTYIENNKEILLEEEIKEIKSQVEESKKDLHKEIEDLMSYKENLNDEISTLKESKEAIKQKSEELLKIEKEIEVKREELNLTVDYQSLTGKIKNLKIEERKYDQIKANALNKIEEYEAEKKNIERELADNSKELIFKRINEIKPYYELMNGSYNQEHEFVVKPIVDNEDIVLKKDFDIDTFIDDFNRFLLSKGRKIKKDDLFNIVTLYFQNFLLIFSGLPGIGKTSLSNLITEYLTHKDCSIDIPVAKGWTSRKVLLGFNNPINNYYQKDEYGFVEKLIGYNESEIDLPISVLLDEANLSPIEYYWSDFISIYDKKDNEKVINIDCKDYKKIKIPNSLRFIATINNDHTTERLSPRLIDRAPIVSLENNALKSFDENLDHVEYKFEGFYSFSEINDFFNKEKNTLTSKEQEILTSIIKIMNNDVKGISLPVSRRKINSIVQYCNISRDFLFKTTSNQFSNIDYAVAQFILPQINGQGKNFSEMLEELKEVFSDFSLQKSSRLLKSMINKGKDFKVFSFFN